MATEQLIVKVADFGLSRIIKEDKEYYVDTKSALPFKWTGRISLLLFHLQHQRLLRFTSSLLKRYEVLRNCVTVLLDVWSFGVCLWEIFTLGMVPYVGVSNDAVYSKISSGYRLDLPSNCPNEVCSVMLKCWESDPEQRPSFNKVL